VFVAVGSFWLVQVVNQAGQEAEADKFRDEPDYIIDRFSTVRMNKEGKPAYIISGDKLTHRPVDDSSVIDKPFVHGLATDQPPMTIHAQTAYVDQAIRASNSVVMWTWCDRHQASAGAAPEDQYADRVPG
jgi:lipopolysaccharide export system protein LptC